MNYVRWAKTESGLAQQRAGRFLSKAAVTAAHFDGNSNFNLELAALVLPRLLPLLL